MIQYYYPQTIKNVTIALLDMFNDIKIHKRDAYPTSATVIKEISVPIQFGNVEKEHLDRTENHYFDKDGNEQGNRYYLQIPRMALKLEGIAYNSDRATSVNESRYWLSETLGLSDEVLEDFQPTPYDLIFSLYIRTDTLDNFSQIVEQILPYFNNKLFLRVKEFSFLNIERDLPVSLNGISPEFVDDMGENDTRHINAILNLTVEAYMYRPFSYSKIIKQIDSRYLTISHDVSFTDTSASVQIDEYSTSGFNFTTETSAFSAISTDSYNFSGYSSSTDLQWFTSAGSYY